MKCYCCESYFVVPLTLRKNRLRLQFVTHEGSQLSLSLIITNNGRFLRQCCIMAKCYSLGARFMDEQPIFGVEPKATALTPVHFLRYFYYGGLVYIGTKRWRDALDSFVMVRSRQWLVMCAIIVCLTSTYRIGNFKPISRVSLLFVLSSIWKGDFAICFNITWLILSTFQLLAAPANVLSSLVVEGYKKMVLVALIMSGNLPTLPKYAPNVVTRHLKSHAAAYEALGRYCQVWL